MSKKWILACLSFFFGTAAFAQEVFKTRILNKEYDVFMQINLYEENVKIPGQDILGETFGYLKKNTDSRVWAITGVEISKDGKKATLEMVNDYGSEDLTAELTMQDDGTYMLKQVEGSTLKVAGKGKWIKLPKILVFNKQ
ncbi:MAG: hypothetical protein K6A78_08855 [Prevotella sp.]|nr:hypothetical protein [Prevotella sp.]